MSESRQSDYYKSSSSSKRFKFSDSNFKKNKHFNETCDFKKRKIPSSQRNENSSDSDVDSEEEIKFSYAEYKSDLIKMFFQDNDKIRKGTEEYADFWKFLAKFENKRRQAVIQQMCNEEKPKISLADKLKSVPVYFKMKSVEQLRQRLPPRDLEDRKKVLSAKRIEEFQHIVNYFLDFLEKQKLEKLCKLKEAKESLPIFAFKEKLLSSIEENNAIILAGDTGCGKSTQVPQYLMEAGYKNIACTQPRRIACISLSKRVSYETKNEYGSKVGYQIRFEKHKTEHTNILFLTEGLLLRQVVSDSMLKSYDVIILDEIHERHLQTDFLLGVIKCLLVQRNDIKVILMSATINISLFYNYFMGKAPVVQIPGRLFPIELKYFPIPDIEKLEKTDKINPAPYVRILQLIDSKYSSEERGDLLVFLSGMKEITVIADAAKLYAQQTNKWIVLCLHSTLSFAEQERVFDVPPTGIRKCILSTNIAETSVTIDGVRFVMDSGKVKEMTHDHSSKVRRLKEVNISQASAEQRKGRAGRTGPGVCFRLYSEKEYASFDQYSTPEIQRVPLESIILQMISMGLPDISMFPFIEPPKSESLSSSVLSLQSHSALTSANNITSIGQLLAKLPMDISLGKMLIMGSLFHQIEPVLSLAAALSVQSPFTNKAYRDPDCLLLNEDLQSDSGDPFTLLSAYREWLYVKSRKQEDSRKWCRKRGLEEQRFFEMTKLREQFSEMLRDAGLQYLADKPATTTAERARRYGTMRQLIELKKEIYKQGPRTARKLKVNQEFVDSDEEDNSMKLKDIDFKIRYDDKNLNQLYENSNVKGRDKLLIKVILCCGLYPNLVVPDEHNNYSGPDQVFHAVKKPGILLHPNSTYAYHPESLQLKDSDIVELPGYSRHRCSSRHQMLAFVSLLETNKTFLINPFRVPTAPTALMFSHSIDTNIDMSIIVCDSFYELKFAEKFRAQELLLKAVHLRQLWKNLLDLRISATRLEDDEKNDALLGAQITEKELSTGLFELFTSDAYYSVRRLLSADVKLLYKGQDPYECEYTNPFSSKVTINDVKGGIGLTEYLTYNCILDLDTCDNLLTTYESFCPYCDTEINVSTLDRLAHMKNCLQNIKMDVPEEAPRNSSNLKEYFCEICVKTFNFGIKDIFKHKNSHKSN